MKNLIILLVFFTSSLAFSKNQLSTIQIKNVIDQLEKNLKRYELIEYDFFSKESAFVSDDEVYTFMEMYNQPAGYFLLDLKLPKLTSGFYNADSQPRFEIITVDYKQGTIDSARFKKFDTKYHFLLYTDSDEKNVIKIDIVNYVALEVNQGTISKPDNRLVWRKNGTDNFIIK